jgi:hypothetical protein
MNNQRHRRLAVSRQGGRRPGAGAPRGNINALKWGLSTGRFYGAPAVLVSLPGIREIYASLDRTHPDDVAYYKELLEAAALFLTWPEGPRQVEELTRAYLECHVDEFDRGLELYHRLNHLADDKSRPVRAMLYSYEVMQHIPALRAHIESRIVPWFWAAHSIARKAKAQNTRNIQSNNDNQTPPPA